VRTSDFNATPENRVRCRNKNDVHSLRDLVRGSAQLAVSFFSTYLPGFNQYTHPRSKQAEYERSALVDARDLGHSHHVARLFVVVD